MRWPQRASSEDGKAPRNTRNHIYAHAGDLSAADGLTAFPFFTCSKMAVARLRAVLRFVPPLLFLLGQPDLTAWPRHLLSWTSAPC
jgi:hypothetical protein